MKDEHPVLVFLLRAGMELCYGYAVLTFVTLAMFHKAFPFPEAVVSFLLAALITLFTAGRGWRMISVVAVHALAFVPVLLRMTQIFGSWSDVFVSQAWFTQYLEEPSGAVEYFSFFLVVAWAFVFWGGGAALAARSDDYATTCSRFDQGLIAFFILFLGKLYLQAALGIALSDPTPGLFIFPFLLFSLLAIGLVRNRSAARREFMPGYQRLGVLLGFIVVILLAGTGLVFFFFPLLTLAAEGGYGLLNVVSGPLVSVLFAIWNWIFGTGMEVPEVRPAQAEPVPQTGGGGGDLPAWLIPILQVAAVGVIILLVLVALAFVGGVLYAVFMWLFSKTPEGERKPSPAELFVSFFAGLRAWLVSFRRGILHLLTGYRAAVQLYTALRDWGRNSGMPNLMDETPTEYGARLSGRFPALAGEIRVIVEAFNREVYGEIAPDEQELAPAQRAWRTLASPRLYQARMRAWFARQ